MNRFSYKGCDSYIEAKCFIFIYYELYNMYSSTILTCNVEVVGSSPIKGPRCFIEQETLPLLRSTGWFQERIRE